MTLRRLGGRLAAATVLLLLMASPASAQGVIGVNGLLSNRTENAFGTALTLAYPLLTGTSGPYTWAFKVLGAGDLEIVTGTLHSPYTRPKDANGDAFYYLGPGGAVDPTVAEASAPTRFYGSLYGVLDIWRLRMGFGGGRHFDASDWAWSGLWGFAASQSTWLMVETPGFNFPQEWRLRVQMKLAGPAFIW